MVPRTNIRPETIALSVCGRYEEGRADTSTTIYPGMALELTTDESQPDQYPPGVKPNSSAGADVILRIAMESLLGNPDETKREGMKVSDSYSGHSSTFLKGDLVPYFIPRPGDIFLARVSATGSFTLGQALKVHSDGTFVAQGGTGTIKAYAMETHDFSADDPPVTPLLRVQAK